MLSLAQIRFCAIECEHQRTSPLRVYDMCLALEFAQGVNKTVTAVNPLTVAFVRRLGFLVEPNQNEFGFRKMPVYFENDPTKQAINADQITRALNSLFTHGHDLSAEEGYYEFQKIHPFNDGNGRVGAILYNIWKGSLGHPIIPPNLFV